MQTSRTVAHIDWRLALKPRQQSLYFFSAVLQTQSSVHKQSQLALASLADTRAALDQKVPPSRVFAGVVHGL